MCVCVRERERERKGERERLCVCERERVCGREGLTRVRRTSRDESWKRESVSVGGWVCGCVCVRLSVCVCVCERDKV